MFRVCQQLVIYCHINLLIFVRKIIMWTGHVQNFNSRCTAQCLFSFFLSVTSVAFNDCVQIKIKKKYNSCYLCAFACVCVCVWRGVLKLPPSN